MNMSNGEPKSHRGRTFSLLDFMTIVAVLVTMYTLVKPGGSLNESFTAWNQSRILRNRIVEQWDTLAEHANKLSDFEGEPDLIEFIDYECPFCREFRTAVDSAVAAGVRISIVHLPLKIHATARSAALIALCANDGGGFAQIHRRLLSEDKWMSPTSPSADSALSAIRTAASPNQHCFQASATENALLAHLRLSDALHITQTPMFVARGNVLRERPTKANLIGLAKSRQ